MFGGAECFTVCCANCSSGFRDLEKPSEGMPERSEWQRLKASTDESFVFSAYYDTRWRPVPLIQIIGILSADLGSVFCRMWFTDSPRPVYSQATLQMVGEDHGRRLHISFLSISKNPKVHFMGVGEIQPPAKFV